MAFKNENYSLARHHFTSCSVQLENCLSLVSIDRDELKSYISVCSVLVGEDMQDTVSLIEQRRKQAMEVLDTVSSITLRLSLLSAGPP